ncbi:MAG: SIS domain-containing protein [Candidatus Thorarchaeota archaeon]|jgi:fructoselysine-6-P-deglycase FrlB-like protein
MTEFLDACYDAIKLQVKAIPDTIRSVPKGMIESIQNKRLVVFVGAGDSYAVSEYGKWAFLKSSTNAVFLSALELHRIPLDSNIVVVGITASGRSLATVGALERGKSKGALTIALTDNPDGKAATIADEVWLTHSGVDSYDISPSASTTTAMAFLLKLASLLRTGPQSNIDQDSRRLIEISKQILDWAEPVGAEIADLADLNKLLYLISDGPNYVAAQIGMMKFNEYSLVRGIAALKEEYQHHWNLSLKKDDRAVLICDSPVSSYDSDFVGALTKKMQVQTYRLFTPKNMELITPLGQAIPNSIALQLAAYYSVRKHDPTKEDWKKPNVDIFKIY